MSGDERSREERLQIEELCLQHHSGIPTVREIKEIGWLKVVFILLCGVSRHKPTPLRRKHIMHLPFT